MLKLQRSSGLWSIVLFNFQVLSFYTLPCFICLTLFIYLCASKLFSVLLLPQTRTSLGWFLQKVQDRIVMCTVRHIMVKIASKSRWDSLKWFLLHVWLHYIIIFIVVYRFKLVIAFWLNLYAETNYTLSNLLYFLVTSNVVNWFLLCSLWMPRESLITHSQFAWFKSYS